MPTPTAEVHAIPIAVLKYRQLYTTLQPGLKDAVSHMISDSDSIQATSQANKHVKPSIQDKSSVVIESALFLKAQGWEPLWVPPGSKNPGRVGWQHERLDEGGIRRKFVNGGNLGIITGEPSSGLVDVDLDAAEANACADEFLPVTGLIHGRPSKPRSHRWYISHPVPRVQQFKDCDGSMLVELRGTGGQTLAPPSVHPEGETLSWDNQGEPARLDLDVLQIACKNLATTALLARHWPGKGSRHQAALAIAGYFLRGRLDSDLVVKIVETAARIAGDEEWQARGRDVRDTVRNQASGKQITGGPTAAELFIGGEKVVARLGQWLQLGPTEGFTVQWTPPVPFVEVAGPEFPTGVFLGHIEELVDAQAVALQVPRDLIACLVIGTASVAASGRGWVRLNREWRSL